MELEQEYIYLSAIDEYFARLEKYKRELGENTALLYHSGDWYEIYGHKDEDDPKWKLEDICSICDLNIGDKHTTHENLQVYVGGIHTLEHQLEKYKAKLLSNNYNVVVVKQSDEMQEIGAKKKKRFLDGVFTPGTYVPTDTNIRWSNHIMSIWIDTYMVQNVKTHYMGITIIDMATAQPYLMEYKITDSVLQPSSMDILEHCFAIYRPKEVCLMSSIDNLERYVPSLKSTYMHHYNMSDTIIQNAEKQTYMHTIIGKYYGLDAINQYMEFQQYMLATQSFCVLVHFLEEHRNKVCDLLKLPIWENKSTTVTLANHTLMQLNILPSDHDPFHEKRHKSSLNSVHCWLNKCLTTMGKRAFLHILTHPSFDTEYLQANYDLIELWLQSPNQEKMETLRPNLKQTNDVCKMRWDLSKHKMAPSGIYKMHQTLQITQHIYQEIKDFSQMHDFIQLNYNETHDEIRKMIRFIQDRFVLENACLNNQYGNYESPVIKSGLYPQLDKLYQEHETDERHLDAIRTYFDKIMSASAKKGEYVKYDLKETRNSYIHMTTKRADSLKKKLAIPPLRNTKVSLENGEIQFAISEVTFQNTGKNVTEIRFPYIDDLCARLGEFKKKAQDATHKIYLQILEELDHEFDTVLDKSAHILEVVDVLWTKCTVAHKYNYSKPILDCQTSRSYVNAKGVRHILIEQLLQNELYVPNDVILGQDDVSGILLFGTNAVGKTSLMRSIGIMMIMAQAGMYVPCSSMVYHPYKSMFSRILNQDNLFKGLSTFAVEMSELRVIHQYADENSLILGDELCSGTETTSALCIMTATLKRLYERKCSFLLATHFHEIMDYEELQELTTIRCCHLAVSYDENEDCLVYDRVLQDGPGNKNYGLEVCKSLYMDPAFLSEAYQIRAKHFPEYEGSLSHKTSKYNSQLVKTLCEMCGVAACSEVHHMQEQQYANEQGYIGSIHKNHKANLMALCEKCHDKMHHGEVSSFSDETPPSPSPTKKVVKRRVKTTKGYKIVN